MRVRASGDSTREKGGGQWGQTREIEQIKRLDLKAAKSLRMYNLNVGNKDEGRWKMMFKFSSWEMGWMVSGTNY